jgi:hypothetical protein
MSEHEITEPERDERSSDADDEGAQRGKEDGEDEGERDDALAGGSAA